MKKKNSTLKIVEATEPQFGEQQLRNFIRYLPISAAIVDLNGHILEISDEWIKTFDWPLSPIAHQSIWKLFYKPPKEWEKLFQEALKGKTLKSNEEEYTTQLSKTIWVEWTVRPWWNGQQIGGAIILINNFTEQKELYREIEQLRYKQLLTSQMNSLGEMAGGLAHEINNPLTVIIGVAERLRRAALRPELRTPELLEQSAEKIQNTTNRIAQIIKGLKTFARDAEEDPFLPVSFQQIINDALPYIHSKLEKHRVEWRWNPQKDFQIECRSVQIGQVLVSLIHNACDAIQNLEIKWISLEVIEEKNGLTILVKDSGRGIPRSIADHIMEPFFTTKDIGKGTGLGLSISKSIIESHRGLLFLDPHSLHTCFVIRLPFSQATPLHIQNGREALSLHLAWKQKLIDGIRTHFAGLTPQRDPLIEWMKEVPSFYGQDLLTEGLVEAYDFLFEQTRVIFDLIQNGEKELVINELLQANSTYNSLSKVFITQLLTLELRRETLNKKKAA